MSPGTGVVQAAAAGTVPQQHGRRACGRDLAAGLLARDVEVQPLPALVEGLDARDPDDDLDAVIGEDRADVAGAQRAAVEVVVAEGADQQLEIQFVETIPSAMIPGSPLARARSSSVWMFGSAIWKVSPAATTV